MICIFYSYSMQLNDNPGLITDVAYFGALLVLWNFCKKTNVWKKQRDYKPPIIEQVVVNAHVNDFAKEILADNYKQ